MRPLRRDLPSFSGDSFAAWRPAVSTGSITYAQFLDDVAAGKVFVGGLGVGSDGAWVTVVGGTAEQRAAYLEYLRTALANGDVKVAGPKLHR
jgi:hypothetical protein